MITHGKRFRQLWDDSHDPERATLTERAVLQSEGKHPLQQPGCARRVRTATRARLPTPGAAPVVWLGWRRNRRLRQQCPPGRAEPGDAAAGAPR